MMARKSVRKVTEDNVVRLQTNILIEIGRRLRDPYNEIVDEGVPARFAELLKRLDDPVEQVDQREPGRSADVLRIIDDSNEEGK
jgi:hypothetical protein